MGKEEHKLLNTKSEMLFSHKGIDTNHLPLSQPFRLVACFALMMSLEQLANRNPRYGYPLHHGPHDSQTACFRGESINLVGALPNIAEEAFNSIGRANVAMHDLRESVKRQQMLFIFHQAVHRFGIALLVFPFKGRQLDERLLFCQRLPGFQSTR